MEGSKVNAKEILAAAAFVKSAENYDKDTASGHYEEYKRKYPHYTIPERPKFEDFLGEYDYADWSEITEALYSIGKAGFTFDYEGEKHFVKELDQHGGEGQGDEYYYVYEVDGKTYKLEAYYASWDGVYWDDAELFEVKPKEVKVIQWVKA
jgi:hypothetical protein